MARNWKFGEAVRAIQAGNKEEIQDIGRRFPLFANLAAQVNEAGAALIDCVPDYCTARKIESVLKGDIQETPEGEGEEEAVEEEAPAKKAAKKPAKAEKKAPAKKASKAKEEEDEDDLESKSAKELFEMCKESGLKVKPKQDKSVYIEALQAVEEDADDEEDDWEEEEEEAPAKKAPAKKASKKAPAKKAEEDDDDEDWDI